jgi:uncharacterized protein (TIRG00374 family)
MPDEIPKKSGGLANWLQVGLGLVLGITFIMLVVQNVNFSDVYALFARASALPLVVATIAFIVDFLLRAVRFWAMLLLATGRRLPLKPTISPFIASFGMSDVLPLRVGDGFRVIWFSRHFHIPAGTVIGTMVVERILDLATIVFLGVVALALVDEDAPAVLVRNFQLVLSLAAIASFALLFAPLLLCRLLEKVLGRFNFKWVGVLAGALRATSAAVVQIGSWQRLAWLAAMSLALWLLESVVLIGAWISLGGSTSALLKPFTAFVFSTLGTLVPSLPGHFGSFEYFGVQAFSLVKVDAATAVAVVLLAHLILWAPTAIFGVCWLLLGLQRKRRNTV